MSEPAAEKKEKKEKKVKKKTTDKEKKPKKSVNVMSQFTPEQMSELKEAFNFMDVNKDGQIDAEDIRNLGANMGRVYSNEEIESMLNDCTTNPPNFAAFLTTFGEHMIGLESEENLAAAFQPLDENESGMISVDELKKQLCGKGDRLTEEEFSEIMDVLGNQALDRKGNFDYKNFAQLLTGSEI